MNRETAQGYSYGGFHIGLYLERDDVVDEPVREKGGLRIVISQWNSNKIIGLHALTEILAGILPR